jgi:acetyl-CoA carboxylase biotin carboxylase subunit/3-methylcrotonyl-CoA carboxylase alpha subunit
MFEKVLIANRGEIAVRIMRTCKALGMRTVAVFAEADAGAYHVRCADEAVAIGPSRVQDSYLSLGNLVEAIVSSGAQAVHPGYGLLSENAEFASAVRALGVTFVGPSESALHQLGDKVRARRLAKQRGLDPPPGTDDPLPPDDPAFAESEAQRIGFPLLVKAAAGGGGIGMQRVDTIAGLESAVSACRARSRAAFGDDRVYIERLLRRPRHIEVQVIADRAGNARALGDRECSVQRRHQKVIEEGPSPAALLTPATRAELWARAAELIRAVDYVGVATVEFITDASTDPAEVFFLEVNARLQVEHPVTELVTGLDLVEIQLRLAAGELLAPEWVWPEHPGHAVELRLYAEDPARGFIPQPGRLERLDVPVLPGIRFDTGYETGDSVSQFYDPLIAKIIASGPDRATAVARLLAAISASRVELVGPKGPRVTNLDFARRVLTSEAFVTGDYDTHLIADLG